MQRVEQPAAQGGFLRPPALEVDGLELAEAERGRRAVDRDPDQATTVRGHPGPVADPTRLDRVLRPQDDNPPGGLQLLLDIAGKFCTTLDMAIPPDAEPGRAKRGGQPFGDRMVGPGIGKIDVCQPRLSEDRNEAIA